MDKKEDDINFAQLIEKAADNSTNVDLPEGWSLSNDQNFIILGSESSDLTQIKYAAKCDCACFCNC